MRLRGVFEQTAREDRAALIAYICAGDPDLSVTEALIPALGVAGADIVELGVPFSDPTADGPTIQRASDRALKAGTTLGKILELVERVRERTDVPIIAFGYYNPILRYGASRFVADAKSVGIDGFLVVDYPVDVDEAFGQEVARSGLDFVPLAAPTTGDDRLRQIAKVATSFVYCVSVTGVTGSVDADMSVAGERAQYVREITQRPVAVGFGIKTSEDVRRVSRSADGVVVGSGLVRVIEDSMNPVEDASLFVRELASAARRGEPS